MSRDDLMGELEKKGIETRTFFIPMHKQPVFQNMGLFKGESYPVAKELARYGWGDDEVRGLASGFIKAINKKSVRINER